MADYKLLHEKNIENVGEYRELSLLIEKNKILSKSKKYKPIIKLIHHSIYFHILLVHTYTYVNINNIFDFYVIFILKKLYNLLNFGTRCIKRFLNHMCNRIQKKCIQKCRIPWEENTGKCSVNCFWFYVKRLMM